MGQFVQVVKAELEYSFSGFGSCSCSVPILQADSFAQLWLLFHLLLSASRSTEEIKRVLHLI